jgi:hypothetical protein
MTPNPIEQQERRWTIGREVLDRWNDEEWDDPVTVVEAEEKLAEAVRARNAMSHGFDEMQERAAEAERRVSELEEAASEAVEAARGLAPPGGVVPSDHPLWGRSKAVYDAAAKLRAILTDTRPPVTGSDI